MKRFYKSVSVGEGNDILLDGRTLKTPRGAAVEMPTSPLAEAVAREWRAQGDEIVPASMPLTKLANAAIDGAMSRRDEIREEIVKFARHDHLCYRANGPAELVRRQSAGWDPILEWAAARYGARLLTQAGVMSVAQPPAAIDALRSALEPLQSFELAALHVMTSICGSLVLALAVANKRASAEEAFALSQIDERFQAERWGVDPEAASRAKKLQEEFKAAVEFFELLEISPSPPLRGGRGIG